MKPMIRMANKNNHLVMEQFGELHESEKLEAALPVLENKWNEAIRSNSCKPHHNPAH